MELLEEGWKTIKRMPRLVVGYILWWLLITVVYRVCSEAARSLEGGNASAVALLRLGGLVALAASGAVLQSIYFAAIGREVDKPLWKCPAAGEAVRRFFLIWFLLILILLTTEQFMSIAAERGDEQAFAALLPIYIFLSAIYFPIAACIMFWGRLNWQELGEALLPMLREMSNVILVMFIMFVNIMLQITVPAAFAPLLDSETPLAPQNLLLPALLSIPSGLLDCLSFVIMFRICMIHRTTDYDSDDFDF
ncbi:MAG: hypothetical protein HYV27_24520 [Candidatus Hydrogenedentes bacterium]|nr:hypothetical protein [Candidatus Hydrogenedentota bacterium]